MITKLLGLFGLVAALPAAVARVLDDEPLLCGCADTGWGCADCQLLSDGGDGRA